MTVDRVIDSVRKTIEEFPEPHRSEILDLWEEWLETSPELPLYVSWTQFSSRFDDQAALFTERRVFLKRVRNELRELEVPLKLWQKVAKGVAAIASVFLILFLAISRVFRVAD